MRRLRNIAVVVLIAAQLAGAVGVRAMSLDDVDLSKLPKDGGEHYNRLIFEKSPYLLQHAENPIDWYPWGDEAFEKARDEEKPVFLSIGYSTCHWCHVMEGESFEDTEVARILKEFFVAVKVDREERPDIDQVYMTVSQVLTGRGGWPLTIIMTPDKKPFYAGTYLPKEGRYGQVGLVDLLVKVSGIWNERRGDVLESADSIAGALRRMSVTEAGKVPGVSLFEKAFEEIDKSFDEKNGGFGSAPKFPRPHLLQFLLRHGERKGDVRAVEMVRKTLKALRHGGIFDQLGYGFHRYSTDNHFLVPHFEKMMYDQALLAIAYLEAYQATGEKSFAVTAGEIFTYVLREMTAPGGGFYSAEDADSDGVEGKFYTWTYDEILKVLGSREGRTFAETFNARKAGNFTDEVSGEDTGLNILHLRKDGSAGKHEKSREILRRHRDHRVRPFRDDKIITSWNGLMIAALARGGVVLGKPRYTEAAVKAAEFLLRFMIDGEGRLLRRYRDGEAALPAYLDDYAFLVFGLTELYQATYKPEYLERALDLNRKMIDLFRDDDGGGFFFSGAGNEELLSPMKESYDGALPSGNSMALLNIVRLARLTGDAGLEGQADKLAGAFSGELERSPTGHTMMLTALDFLHGPVREIVVAGIPGEKDTEALLDAVNEGFRPNQVVILRPPGDSEIISLAPYAENMKMRDGHAAAYVCENFTCLEPVIEPDGLRAILEGKNP